MSKRLPMVQFTEGGDNVDDAFNRICDLGIVVTFSLSFHVAQLSLAEGRKEQQHRWNLEERGSVRATRAFLMRSESAHFIWFTAKISD